MFDTALFIVDYQFFSGHRKSAEGQRSERAESGYASETREGSVSSQRGGSAGKSGTCMLEYKLMYINIFCFPVYFTKNRRRTIIIKNVNISIISLNLYCIVSDYRKCRQKR